MKHALRSRVVAAAVAAFAAGGASGIEVEKTGGDRAVAFAAKEAVSLLGGVPGKIRFVEDPSLSSQEWRLCAKDGDLAIYGRDGQALVYGFYSFLEKYAGFRWYAPDTVRLPDLKGWRIPDIDERGRPAILCREMYVGHDYMDGIWRLRNRETMRSAFDCDISVGSPGHCHTFTAYNNAIKKDMTPEMEGIGVNGKPSGVFCLSHPQVRHLVAEQMKKYIRGDREKCAARKAPRYSWPLVYELSQEDGGIGGCYCPACKALADATGSQSGPNIAFASAVADEVVREFPDVLVRTFAYSYTEMPPTNALRASDNVTVRYCRSFLFQPLTADTDNGEILRRWNSHVKQKTVWSYWRTYSGPLFPAVKPRSDIGAEFKFCREMNVTGYFAENESPLSRSFAMMQHWLFLKLAENPSLDVFALADEFAKAYYGAAAKPVMEYLGYLEKRELENFAKIDRKFLLGVNSGNLAQYVQRSYLDADFFRKANAFLDEAERLAAGDPRASLHVGHERLVVDRAMRSMFTELSRQGYVPDLAAAAARTERTLPALVNGWPFIPKAERKGRASAIAREIAAAKRPPAALPPELSGRDVWAWEPGDILEFMSESKLVDDDEASCGFAVRFPIAQKNHKLPFVAGAYGNLDRVISETRLSADQIPQDGKYHAIRLGKIKMLSPARVYFDWTWRSSTWLPTAGIDGEEREFWVSAKFLGPVYVKGASGENEVRFERLFIVKPQ